MIIICVFINKAAEGRAGECESDNFIIQGISLGVKRYLKIN